MVGLSLYLPTWATDLVRRWRRPDPRACIILSRADRRGEVAAAACPRAARAGVQLGMTIAHARALLPAPSRTTANIIEPIDDERNLRALKRLAVWSLRFVPVVAMDPPDALLIDATGCERLYRGHTRLVRLYAKAIQRLGVQPRIAAAPTHGAAWALARFGPRSIMAVDTPGLVSALQDLPLAALRLDDQAILSLHHVGVETIGQLMLLPRAALADRYGDAVLLRLDQALGQAIEVLTPIRVREPVMAERTLDGPTDRIETIMLVARQLLLETAAQLEKRESGCRRVDVRLDRSDLDPLTISIRTAKATRDARHLWSLLVPRLENAHMGFGVQGVRVVAGALARLRHEQAQEWGDTTIAANAEIGKLVDTLNARLGVGHVLSLRPVESHIPERAFAYEPVMELDDLDRRDQPQETTNADRPSRLHAVPTPIAVTLLVPDGPIGAIACAGQSGRVIASRGPERIEPEWWRLASRVEAPRDYFQITTESGRVLWIFRQPGRRTDEWFLHGEWA
ncbi:MAG: DNA polymerase Y family protein [Planctomycetota bacterium]